MSHATYLVGDVFDRMAELPDGSVDLIVTSPPFLALRSYLPAYHPDKGKEIGSEPTPAAFIDTMLALSAEWRRLLAPHGSIAIELGDTYSGSGGAGGDYNDGGLRERQEKFVGSGRMRSGAKDAPQDEIEAGAHRVDYGYGSPIRNMNEKIQGGGPGWPLAKSKTLIPELYRIALAYGIHPLTGQASPAGTWRIRNVVTWCRPNPPVGALGDKWRPATSDIVVACVSPKRYWDDIATRRPTPHAERPRERQSEPSMSRGGNWDTFPNVESSHPSGAPLLDYWELPPGGYPGSHYAVYPPALVEPLVKAMAPPKVCVECGEPSRRIVGDATYTSTTGGRVVNHYNGDRRSEGVNQWNVDGGNPGHVIKQQDTLGWTDCGHNNYRPALILDPFAGSGTTLMVATGHGHDAIGIDIDERNAKLAEERIGGLFLTIAA